MKSIYKGVLSLFIGIVIISCAGTDSSAQTKVDEKSNLFKAGTPFADSLVSKTPEFAHSVFKGVIDSVPGEYYYHTTDGKIDTLFKKESGQHKPIVSIVYDLLDEQNNFEIKKGSYSYLVEDGVLTAEVDFPKYYKTYWHNRKTKQIAIGILYRDDQGSIHLDSGHSETYFENGKIQQKNDWKDKQSIASKEWNENGVLVTELEFPKYIKQYWDDGKPKIIAAGFLYRDKQGIIKVDSGYSELYFENGKVKEKNDWKDKLPIAHKEWNEKGSLIKEIDFPKYAKEYYDNGKLKKEITGLYRESPTNLESENGYKKEYYENGKTKEHINYKDKEPYSSKQWNEDGALSTEWDISAGYYKYYENGTLRLEAKGFKGFTGEKGVLVENGYQTLYFNNGKPQVQEQIKDKKTTSEKIWDENGTLIIEKDILKGFYKAYFPSGKISRDISGKFHYENKKIIFEDCSVKSWYENGQTEILLKYKDKKLISKKYWYENGNIAFSAELPNHYKVFYEDGKIKAELIGTIAEENGDFKIKDGVYNEYDQNAEVTASTTYKDFQIISEKK